MRNILGAPNARPLISQAIAKCAQNLAQLLKQCAVMFRANDPVFGTHFPCPLTRIYTVCITIHPCVLTHHRPQAESGLNRFPGNGLRRFDTPAAGALTGAPCSISALAVHAAKGGQPAFDRPR